MKKLLSFLLFFLALQNTKAQDIITKQDGEEIKATVKITTPSELHFIPFGQSDTPMIILPKSELFMVKYEDGRKEVFASQVTPSIENSSIDYCTKGKSDAKKYYVGYKTAGTGTLVISLLGFPLGFVDGLLIAIPASLTPPRNKNLNLPANDYALNMKYQSCYANKAWQIKSNKIWTNYGIGAAISAAAIVFILSSFHPK